MTKIISNREIDSKNIVLFPRTQYKGVPLIEIDRDAFTAECKQVKEMGDVWLITQKDYPRHIFQVFKFDSIEQFDMALGQLLGRHETPAYVEGCYDFLVLFIGALDHVHLTQANHKEVDRNICDTRDNAARWWYQYKNGKG